MLDFVGINEISTTSLWGLGITASLAAFSDWRYWRIPNLLLLCSAALALGLAWTFPEGMGISASLIGGVTGLLLFMPVYAVGGMTAGDVKLLGALGLHAGAIVVINIALAAALVGGVWSVVLMATRSSNLGSGVEPVLKKDSRGSIPYGVVIGVATAVICIAA